MFSYCKIRAWKTVMAFILFQKFTFITFTYLKSQAIRGGKVAIRWAQNVTLQCYEGVYSNVIILYISKFILLISVWKNTSTVSHSGKWEQIFNNLSCNFRISSIKEEYKFLLQSWQHLATALIPYNKWKIAVSKTHNMP